MHAAVPTISILTSSTSELSDLNQQRRLQVLIHFIINLSFISFFPSLYTLSVHLPSFPLLCSPLPSHFVLSSILPFSASFSSPVVFSPHSTQLFVFFFLLSLQFFFVWAVIASPRLLFFSPCLLFHLLSVLLSAPLFFCSLLSVILRIPSSVLTSASFLSSPLNFFHSVLKEIKLKLHKNVLVLPQDENATEGCGELLNLLETCSWCADFL